MKVKVFARDSPLIVTPVLNYENTIDSLIDKGYQSIRGFELCKNKKPKHDILMIKENKRESLLLKKDFVSKKFEVYTNPNKCTKYIYRIDDKNCICLYSNDLTLSI